MTPICLLATLLFGLSRSPPARPPPRQKRRRPPRKSQIFVVAANPLAVEAGMAVLRRGGSAADAAVAVQAMLWLVEPQSSGLGGGAFMTWFDGATGEVDGLRRPRNRAGGRFAGDVPRRRGPAAAVPERGASAGAPPGCPGAVGMLAMVQAEHGKLAVERAVRRRRADSRRKASSSRRGSAASSRAASRSSPRPTRSAYFAEGDGTLLDPGDRLRNPAYAAFLRRLAAQGPDALYAGEIAQRIVARTTAEPLAGTMTLADLAAYRPVKREALCRPYRVYRVCVPPPPSSGVALLQLFGDAGADRHRRARARRSAGLVPVRRGEPADVRRPRPLRRRPGVRGGAGRGPARSRLCRRAGPADRRQRRPRADRRHARRARSPAPRTARSSPPAPRISSSATATAMSCR